MGVCTLSSSVAICLLLLIGRNFTVYVTLFNCYFAGDMFFDLEIFCSMMKHLFVVRHNCNCCQELVPYDFIIEQQKII